MYELFAKAEELDESFLIRIVQNRMTAGNKRILDEIRKKWCQGWGGVTIPRDSRSSIPEREAVLQIRYALFTVKRPHILNPVKALPESVEVNVIYVKEEHPSKGHEPIERFHYVLKSGCTIEKLQERSIDKTVALILMYSIIAVMILNMTYMGRLKPEASCSVLLGPDEWKLLYRIANKTKKEPSKPYSMKEAVDYLGWLGGPKRAPSDGPPGVKNYLDWVNEAVYSAGIPGLPRMNLWVKFSAWLGDNTLDSG
jgi:hypothetical protein